MNYPDELIRGIPNDTYLEDGYPNTNLFNNFEENQQRDDNFLELSINWYDNHNALNLIYDQKKANGELQFKTGAAIITMERLEELCKRPPIRGKLLYERRIVEGNEYHGNLLLKKGVSRLNKNMIASGLALCVDRVEHLVK